MAKTKAADPRFFYEGFAGDFDKYMNMYDLEKRVRLVFGKLLKEEEVRGSKLLDAGCGTGWFSRQAVNWGAKVTSLDMGENLLAEVAKKCDSERIVGDITRLPFPDGDFDIVVCSEVIEHVVDPKQAIRELARVVKPGGILVITTPNLIWKFAIVLANVLKVRPYEGLENWISYRALRAEVQKLNLSIEQMFGFHIVPFVWSKLYGFIDRVDRYGEKLGPVMLNIAVRAHKAERY
jgi:2-polyprenyl-3-methyl-5-hydroxy-6-metoxy-1,4-benzoquinol methylase